MLTLHRRHFQNTISYNRETYTYNPVITACFRAYKTDEDVIQHELRKEKRKGVIVAIMHRNLEGKRDAHGKPYMPQLYVFATAEPIMIDEAELMAD